MGSARYSLLPSPLAGECGSRGAFAKREPGEGSVLDERPDPSPDSLTAFAWHPLPQGERVRANTARSPVSPTLRIAPL